MNKQAISVTLAADNIVWLRGQARAAGRRSVSDFLDRLVSEVRAGGVGEGRPAVQSVVGSVRILASDPELRKADAAVRDLVRSSLSRPIPEPRPGKAGGGRKGPTKPARG